MIKENVLKYNGQCPRLMYVLVILTKLSKYLLSSTITFRCFYNTWSGPEVDELLHFLIIFLNFFIEKDSYPELDFIGNLFNKLILIWWFCTKLNV